MQIDDAVVLALSLICGNKSITAAKEKAADCVIWMEIQISL